MAALFTVFQSGLLVSGNTRLTLAQQITSGAAISSVRVSGNDEYVQLYLSQRSSVQPVTGSSYVGIVNDIVTEEIFIRRATYDVSGANNQAMGVARQRVVDSIITVASGAFNSGFNLPRPYLINQKWPMPSELFAKAQLDWRFHYIL